MIHSLGLVGFPPERASVVDKEQHVQVNNNLAKLLLYALITN